MNVESRLTDEHKIQVEVNFMKIISSNGHIFLKTIILLITRIRLFRNALLMQECIGQVRDRKMGLAQ